MPLTRRQALLPLRVGDLAEVTGLTVRTLHHYEHIGLVQPTTRSAAGHRLYGADAVDRLYQVCRLRQLGISLDQVARALDDPHANLRQALSDHRDDLDRRLASESRVRTRLTAALTGLDEADVTRSADLITILEDMTMLESLVRQRISILVYRDLQRVYDSLIDVFGFEPGEVTTAPDGSVVHAELSAGDGVVWLHPETETYGLASPASLGAATASMAIMVADVDEHYQRAKAKGADIVYEPVDQPYGYREYSARDLEGALWSFMKPLE